MSAWNTQESALYTTVQGRGTTQLNTNQKDNRFSPQTSVLAIENNQKFDLKVISNSIVEIVGDYREAMILQQFHYFIHQKYGKVIDGFRWIYKSIKELKIDVFPFLSISQLRRSIANLVEKGFLIREHLFHKHHGHNLHVQNRTYYYRLDYQKILESVEALSFVTNDKSVLSPTTNPFCHQRQNITENTSTENNHRKYPSPSPLPSQKRESEFNLDDPWIDLEPAKEETSTNQQEINSSPGATAFNQKTKVPRDVVQNKLSEQQVTKVERPKPPWRSPEEFNAFYRALVAALPVVANSHSPQGLAKVIIKDLEAGKPHAYWDDWKNGDAIGTSDKPEWEASPGIPYPMFVEYLAEKCKQAHDSAEKAQEVAWGILSRPKEVKGFWGQFKRSVMNVSKQVAQDIKLGVSNPNTPVWMRERVEPTIEEALSAGENIKALEQGDISKIDILSATKVMPKAKEESNKPTITNHINQMSLETINQLLQKPLMRKHFAPQLVRSDRFDVELNELGQPINVRKKSKN